MRTGVDGSQALRGPASRVAYLPAHINSASERGSVNVCIPTQSVGMINATQL